MTEWTNSVLTGDVRERLDDLSDSSVHMVMTSPPYFGLRDYGHEDQIGLEDELDAYIEELVAVFREVRRVLRPDGSAWLNLGDSYATARQNHTGGEQIRGAPEGDYATREEGALGRKNKMLVPHRVAIALQSDGWVVRNDVTWLKPNPMPSSVKDRLNTTTEQIFHLTPKPDYWYDLDAIREPHAEASVKRMKHGKGDNLKSAGMNNSDNSGGIHEGGKDKIADEYHAAGKNPGDVFEVTTKPFADAHFAVYPPELCEKPLKATCPPKVCAECGSPYEREVEVERKLLSELPESHPHYRPNDYKQYEGVGDRNDADELVTVSKHHHKGWTPTCDCDTDTTEAGIALDPFAGAGTTLLKAKELGRQFVGIELNAKYADMARARVGIDVKDPSTVRDDADQSGLEAYD